MGGQAAIVRFSIRETIISGHVFGNRRRAQPDGHLVVGFTFTVYFQIHNLVLN